MQCSGIILKKNVRPVERLFWRWFYEDADSYVETSKSKRILIKARSQQLTNLSLYSGRYSESWRQSIWLKCTFWTLTGGSFQPGDKPWHDFPVEAVGNYSVFHRVGDIFREVNGAGGWVNWSDRSKTVFFARQKGSEGPKPRWKRVRDQEGGAWFRVCGLPISKTLSVSFKISTLAAGLARGVSLL